MTHPEHEVRAVVAAYADAFAAVAAVTTGRTRRGRCGTVLAVTGAPVAALNVVVSPAREPDVEEIVELAAGESPWGVPWSVHVRGSGEDVVAAAPAFGLSVADRIPLMVRPGTALPPQEPSRTGLRVRDVGAEELERWGRTLAAGFGAPYEVLRVLTAPGIASAPGVTCYLAEVDGVPVATGMAVRSGDLTGLFNVATLPEHRRLGHGRAVTAAMLRAADDAGAPVAYLGASAAGESVYRSLGFRTVEHLTVLTASV